MKNQQNPDLAFGGLAERSLSATRPFFFFFWIIDKLLRHWGSNSGTCVCWPSSIFERFYPPEMTFLLKMPLVEDPLNRDRALYWFFQMSPGLDSSFCGATPFKHLDGFRTVALQLPGPWCLSLCPCGLQPCPLATFLLLTCKPRCSSLRERRISLVRMFMRSHSWKATTM